MVKRSKLTKRQVAEKYGFRSGFEMDVCKVLEACPNYVGYECEVLHYTQPEKERKYTPDFVLMKKDGTKMYIETKGRWSTEDRMKHLMLRDLDLDIRLVFQNRNAKIRKGSKTSYADYCVRYGLTFSPINKQVPKEWLEE